MNAQRDGGVTTSGNNTSLSVTSGKVSNKSLKKLFIAISGLLVTTVCLQNTAFAASQTATLQQQVNKLQKQLSSLNKKVNSKVSKANYMSKTQYVVGGNSYIYTDSHGPKKFEQLSSADIPLSLLKMKNMYPQKSLVLGGLFEFEPVNSWYGDDLSYTRNGKHVNYHHGTASSVSDVNFDAMMNVNDYTQVFTQFAYTGSDGNISLMSGFVTFGNLKKLPFFASVGKFRPRFGVFPGLPYGAPIPQGIFRPGHLVNTTVGYSSGDLDVYATYLPTSVTKSDGNSYRENGVMASAFYSGQLSKAVSYGVNAGYVSDVATTGSGVGKAVAAASDGYKKVPAVDVDANVSVGPVNLSGGYQTTTKKSNGVSTAKKGEQKASSYYAQLAYSLNVYNKPVTLAVNYSKAKNTENVAMPMGGDIDNGPVVYGVQKALGVFVFTNITKSLAAGLEYERLNTYAGKKTNEITLYGAVYF